MSRPAIEVLQDGAGVVEVLVPGFPGADGLDGASVPAGGSTGQQLTKNSNADFDFTWATPRALASEAEAQAGTENTKIMTPLRVAQAVNDRVRQTRQINTGTGILGGGDLSADRTLSLNLASEALALAGLDNETVMTPLRVAQSKADRAPASRQITAGTGLTGGGDLTADRSLALDVASQAEAELGASNGKAMTPLRTAQAIGLAVAGQLKTSDFASQAEAEAGTSNTRVMTPLRVAQAIALELSTLPAALEVATEAEALAGLVNNKVMTPLRVAQAIEAGTIGAGDINQYLASQAQAEAGVDNGTLMTPLRTAQAITTRITNNLTTSSTTQALSAEQGRQLQDNKVGITRQVATGVGLTGGGALSADRTIAADLASQAEAEAGFSNTKLMTPLRTAQALANRVVNTRQVLAGTGLSGGGALSGDVMLSLQIASQAEAIAGGDNAKAMTALRVAQATADVVRNSRQVIAGTGLTGGGDLSTNRTLSADLASQAEAQAGSDNTKLMTPLRVAEAIAALGGGGGGGGTATVVTSGTAINSVPTVNGYRIDASIASTSAAQIGTESTTLMTPQRTHEAIDSKISASLGLNSDTVALAASQGLQLNNNKADKSIQIVTTGGITGGGDLSANRTLALQYASASEVIAGLDGMKVVTPYALKAAGIGGGSLTPVVTSAGGTIQLVVGQFIFHNQNVSPVFRMPASSSPGQVLGCGAYNTYTILTGEGYGLQGRIMSSNSDFIVDRTNMFLTFMCFRDPSGFTDWRII